MLRPEAQEQGDLAQGRSARPATSPSRRGAVGMVSGCRVSVQRGVRTTCAVRGREGAAGMKILFLDIDGVILSGRALWATGDNTHLPADAKIGSAAVRERVCRYG